MKIQYQLFLDDKLLMHKFIGDFSYDHWKSYFQMIMGKYEWNSIEKVLVDLRKTHNIDKVLKEVHKIQQYRLEVIKKNFTTVILVDTPAETASAHLYIKELLEKFPYAYCVTTEHAKKLLRINKSLDEFKQMLNSLNNSF